MCLLLAAVNAAADEPLSCRTSLIEPLTANPFATLVPLADPNTIQLEAGNFEAQLGDLPTASMSGGVLLRRNDKLAAAESARYEPTTKALHLEGDVRFVFESLTGMQELWGGETSRPFPDKRLK